MKYYHAVTYVFFLTLLCSGCFNDKKKKCSDMVIKSKITYEQVCNFLDTISSKYKEKYIEFPQTLNEDMNFRNIINNPCEYKPFLIEILKDDRKGNVNKLIALYGLQHLCVNDYIEVLHNVFDEYRNEKVDEFFMMSSISQGGFSLEVCKNYTNQQLQQVLKSILPTLKIETNRKFINDIISGDSWRKLRKYFKESGEPIPWTCDESS